MKTKFKVLTCVLAAAVSVPVVASAATAINKEYTPQYKFGSVVDKEATFVMAAEMRDDEWFENFELALLDGKCPTDPVSAATIGAESINDSNEILPAYIVEAASVTPSTEVKLTKVHDKETGGTGYTLWSGRFIVNDVAAFASKFGEPTNMDCNILLNGRGRLDYKNGYSVNYKELSGSYTYKDKNDKTYTKLGTNPAGTGKLPEIRSTYNGSDKLVEMALYFYLYRGDSSSAFDEIVVIHSVDNDYANSAEYAQKSYANLIGSYTYVDTDNLSKVDA